MIFDELETKLIEIIDTTGEEEKTTITISMSITRKQAKQLLGACQDEKPWWKRIFQGVTR